MQKSDYLVIGSGIAGLSFALKVAQFGTVHVVTKKEHTDANTNRAQGGIAAVTALEDSFDSHIQDTMAAGAGLCDEAAVRILVTEGPARIRELVDWGVRFSKSGDDFDLALEGGHSHRRILHVKDMTGEEIEHSLIRAVCEHPSIEIFEHHMALDLITEHHLGVSRGETCFGAYVVDDAGKIQRFLAKKATMLSTGGAAQVYSHSTNPDIATGDGIAMAYRAGARIGNLEFMQFHPTGLYFPSDEETILISEAVRGFGAKLMNRNGKYFAKEFHQRGELAPRDVVARGIDAEIKRSGEPCVYLEIPHEKKDQFEQRFPTITRKCRERGIQIPHEPIPVVPSAHYLCGGVVTNLSGQTNIKRLFACGETAHAGVHGANRLASNSLLEALVFSHRAAQEVITFSRQPLDKIQIPKWDASGTTDLKEWILISHNRSELQSVMQDYVGIIRTNARLHRAKNRVEMLGKEIEEFYAKTRIFPALVELRNLVAVAHLIIKSALLRKESRGLHQNTDYPKTNSKQQDVVLMAANPANGINKPN